LLFISINNATYSQEQHAVASRCHRLLQHLLSFVQTIQYVSDLGGVFGLWFGFAFMTLIEMFELCSDLFVLSLCKLYDIADRRH